MILEIDENSYASIRKGVKILTHLKEELRIKSGKQVVADKAFEKAYSKMLLIYNQHNVFPGEHYVYAHINPLKKINIQHSPQHLFCASVLGLNFEPFYIGKGIYNRAYELNRNDSHKKIRSKVLEKGSEIEVVKIAENLSENCAFDLESRLIDILGLKVLHDDNLLVNLDEGAVKSERRKLYPKGSAWLLNRNKMQTYQDNHSL